MHVITLPLKVEPWQSDVLKKRMLYEQIIYNQVLDIIRPRLYRLKRKLDRNYKQSLDYAKTLKATVSDAKELDKKRKEYLKELNTPVYDKFGCFEHKFKDGHTVKVNLNQQKSITNLFSYFANHYNLGEFAPRYYGLSSMHLSSLGNDMWLAINSLLYGDGEVIKYKKRGRVNHIPNKTDQFKTGVRINLNGISVRYIHVDNKRDEKSDNKWMTLPFILYKGVFKEYERHSLGDLSQPYVDKIKKVNIIKVFVRGKDKYYVQFTVEGRPFDKNRKLGVGVVGVDVNAHNIAVVSQNNVSIDTFQQDIIELERKKRILQRKIERSRRALNPNKYNEDGTYKKGSKGKWKKSKRQNVAAIKLREAQRKLAAKRKMEQTKLANKYLEYGDTFKIENVDWTNLAKRAKETKINEKTGRCKSKKRYGKSVGANAPGQMTSLIKQKVIARGGKVIDIDTLAGCTRFDFISGEKHKHPTKERSITLANGVTHQRDLIAAFNIAHCGVDRVFDVEQMRKDYDSFKTKGEHEMYLHVNGFKKTDSSIVSVK